MHCNIACFCTGNDFLLKNEDDMVITTIDELFDGPWGTVEFRRKEIEAGSCGAFDRIFNEEVDNNFPPIQKLTVMIDYHESTVRDRLRQCHACYIKQSLSHLHYQLDVEIANTKRSEREADRKASRTAAKHRIAT
jgi:hypothetical protein